jgi:hypothetical protein
MKAYHNDPDLKKQYVEKMKQHMLADEIIQGNYWTGKKGCAVGCTIEGSDHKRYETVLGIPEVFAHLEDRLFELMNLEDAKSFPLEFLESINVGADLRVVMDHFFYRLLVEPQRGIIVFAQNEPTKKKLKILRICL